MEEEEAATAESQTRPNGEDSCAELTAGAAAADVQRRKQKWSRCAAANFTEAEKKLEKSSKYHKRNSNSVLLQTRQRYS